MTTQPVAIYQLAYVPGEVALCSLHANHPPQWLGSIGPVSYGTHEGCCKACCEEERETDTDRAAEDHAEGGA